MINLDYDKEICRWIDAHREQILEDWLELIRIPSVQGQAQPKAPYGIQCARALNKAAQLLERRGFSVCVNEEDGYALSRFGTGEKVIGLFGHSDVVPVSDDWMFTKPFEPIIKEGCIIGRGCSDNKNGVMAAACVMEALRDCAIPMGCTVQTFVGSNEESGMADVMAFARKEAMPDLSLVPDMTFPCSLGEKGILRLWAENTVPLSTIRDFRGGDAFNIVLDHVEVTLPQDPALEQELRALTCGREEFSITSGQDALIFTANGIAKHAASPEGGVNATVLAAEVLIRCRNLAQGDREALQVVCSLLSDNYGAGMGIDFTDSAFGPLTAANGMVAVEQGKLRVSLDIRYGTQMPTERLEQLLHKAWEEKGWQIVYLYNSPGFDADADSPIPDLLVELTGAFTGQECRTYRANGGTYARYLKNAFAVGSSAAIPDQEPLTMVMPAGRGGAHQCDERCRIDNFFQGLRILIHAVILCDRQLCRKN